MKMKMGLSMGMINNDNGSEHEFEKLTVLLLLMDLITASQ
jgi:hypothetical protein